MIAMQAFDFFCGAGGLTRGLLDSGIDVIAGFDLDGNCKETYEHNNPGVRFVNKDIREVNISDLKCYAQKTPMREMLFAGCAPCQPFSSQRKFGVKGKDKTLLGEFGRLVAVAKPKYVLIENVPGMAKVPGFSTFRRFLNELKKSRYEFVYGLLDAKHFGVPQNRRRLVLLASRASEVFLPEPKFGKGSVPYQTVRGAISHFPELSAGDKHQGVPNHACASITPINIERLRSTKHDGGGRLGWPEHLRLNCHKGDYEGHTDVYGRMSWDAPAPTLTARCHSISNGRYGHPCQDRAISFREAAALQTFPDNYVFYGSNKQISQQIGNAVPVRLAEVLGLHILKLNASASNRGRS